MMKRNVVFTVTLMFIMTLCACGTKQEAPVVEFDARAAEQVTESAEKTSPETLEFSVEDPETQQEALPELPDPTPEQQQSVSETAEQEPSLLTDLLSAGLLEHMGAFTEEDIFDYYGIDPERCDCVFAYADSEGSAAELVYVLAAVDYIPEVGSLLKDHLASREEQYSGYDAEGAKMIKNASMVVGETSVYMVVAPDTAPYLSAFEPYKG